MAVVMQRGKHTGEPITRVPPGYLRWMVRVEHDQAKDAAEELKRRGMLMQATSLEVTAHAVDRASIRCLDVFLKHRDEETNEGLHTWLCRTALEAVEQTKPAQHNHHGRPMAKHRYLEMTWVFDLSMATPILTTVY